MIYKYNEEKLKYIPITSNSFLIFLRIALIFFGAMLFLGLTYTPTIKYITNTENVLIVDDENEFNEERLIDEINKLNFRFPHIILAQARLESGNFSSKIFIENHNLFGMKEARVRLNLAKGTQHGHAYYNSWEESITDYALWYSTYAYKCKSEKQLYKLLDKQYAEATNYVTSLQHIILVNNLKEKFE
mgnify:FL=1|tara:strand:- start:150 stop:713 length:564 start_codon:yes stop_codon:yes gene_type:complete